MRRHILITPLHPSPPFQILPPLPKMFQPGAVLNRAKYMELSEGLALSPQETALSSILELCTTDPPAAIKHLLHLAPENLTEIAKDQTGHRFVSNHLGISLPLRVKMLEAVITFKQLVPLASNNFGNFVVQKLLEFQDTKAPTLGAILENAHELTFHRYGCRVIQRMVTHTPPEKTYQLLQLYAGSEAKVAKDQNGNHIVQCILEYHTPLVYGPFIIGMTQRQGVVELSSDRYGCRVVQACLEKVASYCESPKHSSEDKKIAYAVLHALIEPILRHTLLLAENEFANYIVQYVIRTDFLKLQRNYIIKNTLLHNILWLSQGKYASHVIELALRKADDDMLRAMFSEILDGYEKDERGRGALDIMLFDQYANYVVQCMLEISIAVYLKQRAGDKQWFDMIADRVLFWSNNLVRYSSGKKILSTIQAVLSGSQPSTMCQMGSNLSMLLPQLQMQVQVR